MIRMIHVSDIRKYERCETLLWRTHHEPQPFFPFVHPSASISELAVRYFGLTDYYEGKPGDDAARALQALAKEDVLVNPRFEAQGVRIKVTLMRRGIRGFHVYFGYRSCYPHESEAQVIADHLSILHALQIEVEDVSILCLNADYERRESLDVSSLLLVSDRLFNQKNRLRHTIRELCEPLLRPLEDIAAACQKCLDADVCPSSQRKGECTRGGRCRYFDACFPQALPDDSILYLQQSAHKLQMYAEGITRLQDVDPQRVEGFRFQYAQIAAARNGGLAIDRPALRQWLQDVIVYPITYLDFEWDTYAVPPYEGMRPYDVLCFQYSMDIEPNPQSALIHREFLGEEDCRITFLEQLLKDLPPEGVILVYNMEGAEKLRLRQLAKQFPAYAKRLEAVAARMADLSLLFSAGIVHHIRMHGMYSLKTLLPIFSAYSYQDLDISFGMDAVRQYREMKRCSKQERRVIRRQLLTYCGMDTYAEYVLLHALIALAKEKEADRPE